MSPLTEAQKARLISVRSDVKQTAIEVYSESETTPDSDDAYNRDTTLSSGSRIFSGAIGWGRTLAKEDSAGGYRELSDVSIVASMDEYSYLQVQNAYLVVDGQRLAIKHLVKADKTDEVVIYCERSK